MRWQRPSLVSSEVDVVNQQWPDTMGDPKSWLLWSLVLLPALGALSIAAIPKEDAASARTTAFFWSLVTFVASVPLFFLFDQGGRKYPAAVHVDGTLVAPQGLFGAASATRVAAPGDRITRSGRA